MAMIEPYQESMKKVKLINEIIQRNYVRARTFTQNLEKLTNVKYNLDHYGIQGSAIDGTLLARNVQPNRFECDLLEIEIDMILYLAIIPENLSDFVENTDMPGYLKIKYDEQIRNCFFEHHKKTIAGNQNLTEGYYDARTIFNNTNYREGVYQVDTDIYKSVAKLVFDEIGEVEIEAGHLDDWENEDVANSVTIDIKGAHDTKRTILDQVPTIKLKFWPEQAKEWLGEGKWPSTEQRTKIAYQNYCGIVTKTPSPNKTTEWRLSFSDVESCILQTFFNQDENAYMCCLLFKCLYYRHFKSISCSSCRKTKSSLPSYIIKTIILLASDKYMPGSECWKSPLVGTRSLLLQLKLVLESARLPHYILSDINILRSFMDSHDCDIVDKIISEITSILADLDIVLEKLCDIFEKLVNIYCTIMDKVDTFIAVLFESFLSISSSHSPVGLLICDIFVTEFVKRYAKTGKLLSHDQRRVLKLFHSQLVSKINSLYGGMQLLKKITKTSVPASDFVDLDCD